jgi:hypothetical protein
MGNLKEMGVKMIDITLRESYKSHNTKTLRYHRFAIKIVQASLLPGYVDPMESHAFLLTPHPVLSKSSRSVCRTKFEALINSQTDSALTSFLEDGSLLPLSQLGELLRRLVEMT